MIVALITWSLGRLLLPRSGPRDQPRRLLRARSRERLAAVREHLAHEFGHALVARQHGIEVEEIDLWLLGGVSRMSGRGPRPRRRAALRARRARRHSGDRRGVRRRCWRCCHPRRPAAIRALVEYQVLVNSLILVFNLLPAFPLDGGRVLRSLLWRRSGRSGDATQTAASVGRGFGYLMIVLGALEFIERRARGAVARADRLLRGGGRRSASSRRAGAGSSFRGARIRVDVLPGREHPRAHLSSNEPSLTTSLATATRRSRSSTRRAGRWDCSASPRSRRSPLNSAPHITSQSSPSATLS